LHLVTLNIFPYPNAAPFFDSPPTLYHIELEDDPSSADRLFFYKLPQPKDPDFDSVTVEMITNLEELKFITFNP